MLHNVVDITDALVKMAEDKHIITKELVGCLSPYMSGFTTLYHDFLKGQLETYRVIL